MTFISKIIGYSSKSIIKLIICQISLLFSVALFIGYSEYHIEHYYEKPARESIANQNNKGKVAHIIARELLRINAKYEKMLLSRNNKHISNLSKSLFQSIQYAQASLPVLQNGGTIIDVQLINYYDKDEIKEEITYQKPDNEDASVDVINLAPKFVELKQLVNKTIFLLRKELSKNNSRSQSYGNELIMTIKQTEALLLRLEESANNIYNGIRQATIASEQYMSESARTLKNKIFIINVIFSITVILVATLIVCKIFQLLEGQREFESKNRKLSTVIKQSLTSIIIADKNGNVEYVNPFFEKQTGYSRKEVIGWQANKLNYHNTPEKTQQKMWETIQSGNVWSGQVCSKRKDGSFFYEEVAVSPVFDAEGDIVNLVSVQLDITDKIRMMAKIKETNKSLHTLIDNIPVGVVLINSQKKIIQINEPASKILKFESLDLANEKLLGRICNDGFCETDPSRCPILDLGESRVHFTEKKLFIKDEKQDKKITILKSVIPITLNDNHVLMEVFIDISERKRYELALEKETKKASEMARRSVAAEDRLKRHSENLENIVHNRTVELQQVIFNLKSAQSQLIQSEKLASIGQLAAGIAHEINTPIQYVGDNARFLQDAFNDINTLFNKYEQLPNVQKEEIALEEFMKEVNNSIEETDMVYLQQEIPRAIEQTLEGVLRVSEIVRSMKDFSHPGGHEKIVVDINRAIENTIAVSRNEWKYVADMETDLDTSLPRVPCLPGELNQVFLNMIINAAHAIGDVVGDGLAKKGVIRISTRKDGDHVEIRISDTGSGIPEEFQTKIFDPFFTTKDVGKGSGQGLAISRSVIVEKHGGNVSFETDSGKGTTFVIAIPLIMEN